MTERLHSIKKNTVIQGRPGEMEKGMQVANWERPASGSRMHPFVFGAKAGKKGAFTAKRFAFSAGDPALTRFFTFAYKRLASASRAFFCGGALEC